MGTDYFLFLISHLRQDAGRLSPSLARVKIYVWNVPVNIFIQFTDQANRATMVLSFMACEVGVI
jgi:hypothetical protein